MSRIRATYWDPDGVRYAYYIPRSLGECIDCAYPEETS
jgi:hypothetical protein